QRLSPRSSSSSLRLRMTSISPFSTSRSVTSALGYSALNDSAASTACARTPYLALGLPLVATSKCARVLLVIPESMRGPLALAPPALREGRQGGFECHRETEYRSFAAVVVGQRPHPWPAGGGAMGLRWMLPTTSPSHSTS